MASDVVNPGFYANFGALTTLGKQVKQKDPQAIREAARQFESLFTEMMLKSMRAAKLGDGLGESDESDFYQDMYDQQLAVQMSQGKGLGLADMLMQQLTRHGLTASAAGAQGAGNAGNTGNASGASSAVTAPASGRAAGRGISMGMGTSGSRARPLGAPAASSHASHASPVQERIGFVQKLLPYAQRAASALGVSADTLIAQAALETGWGQHVVGGAAPATGSAAEQGSGSTAVQGTSNNFFGIKAGGTWQGASVTADTSEYSAGSARHVAQSFRAYGSTQQSFNDYVSLIKGRSAYQGAAGSGANATAFASALQRGGYATDPDYVHKLVATTQTVKSLRSLSAASDAGLAGPAAGALVDAAPLKLLAGAPIHSGEEPA